MARPTWFHIAGNPEKELIGGIWAIGNAFVWWAMLPMMGWCAVRGARTGDPRLGLLATMGLGLWLFWILQPRGQTFMHYMLTSIPFVAIALAAFLWAAWQRTDDALADGPLMPTPVRRGFVVGYLGLAVAWFAFYYQLFVSILVPLWYFKLHVWFGEIWL